MSLKSFAAALLALSLAACNPPARANLAPVSGDAFLGPVNAKVVVMEYGSPTCPACKAWHDTFFPDLKHDYIDTGKVKFIWREFAIHGAIDAAIFSIARCTGKDDFFSVLDEAYLNQNKIVEASMKGEAQKELDTLGAKFQLSPEQVKSCMNDKEIIRRINDVRADTQTKGIDSTPTFVINGTVMQQNDWPSIKAVLDAALNVTLAPADAAPAPATPTETPAAPAAAAPAPATPAGPLHGPDEPH